MSADTNAFSATLTVKSDVYKRQRYASEVTTVPIVNAGDGANQHPSQTMLDLYSIYKTQGTLENLSLIHI